MVEKMRGLYWSGVVDYEAGEVHSKAYYKMTPVENILRTLNQTEGDPEKAAEALNWDADEFDNPFRFSAKDVVQVAEYASENPVATVREI